MLCLVAIEEDINEGNAIGVDDDNPSYDGLSCAFKELHDEMEKLLKRHNF